jgi:hypothetical protein
MNDMSATFAARTQGAEEEQLRREIADTGG